MSVITPREFREALHDWLGDKVKFHPDWPHATTNGGFDAHGIVHHWDAIGKRYRLGTHLRVLRYGHAGLPGPLCHCSPARNGDLWVIGWGNCNHAGLGDSRVLAEVLRGRFDGSPAARYDNRDGNEVFYGFEYQYHPDDGPMPEEQVETGILAAAAICEAHGWTDPDKAAGSNLDHFEWASRKWDREKDHLAHRTREGVRAALSGDFTGDDMDINQMVRRFWHHRITTNDHTGRKKDNTRTAEEMLAQTHRRAGDARNMIGELARVVGDTSLSEGDRAAIAADIADRVDALSAEEMAERLDLTVE